jgi:hypothetical protein
MHDNTANNRYELAVDDQTAFADYRKDGHIIYITHVETPPALRGKGTAGQLMQEIAEHAKSENLKLVPICGYASTWLQRHKEYESVMA